MLPAGWWPLGGESRGRAWACGHSPGPRRKLRAQAPLGTAGARVCGAGVMGVVGRVQPAGRLRCGERSEWHPQTTAYGLTCFPPPPRIPPLQAGGGFLSKWSQFTWDTDEQAEVGPPPCCRGALSCTPLQVHLQSRERSSHTVTGVGAPGSSSLLPTARWVGVRRSRGPVELLQASG